MIRSHAIISVPIMLGVALGVSYLYSQSYRVGRHDVLRIEVPGDSEFTREAATVTEGGTISLPILGELKVSGLTPLEISELIRNTLVERNILTEPVVSVSVRDYRSQSVTILGEVKTTGKYYLKGVEKLVEKLAEAGGLSATAGDITISRSTPGENKVFTIKNDEFLLDDTVLESGDVIFVRPKEITQVFVSGEVMSARPMTYTEGLTLSQAILMAGGLNRFGSKSKITIKRTVDGEQTIIKANLSDIEKGKAKDIPLLPNDSIMVGRRFF